MSLNYPTDFKVMYVFEVTYIGVVKSEENSHQLEKSQKNIPFTKHPSSTGRLGQGPSSAENRVAKIGENRRPKENSTFSLYSSFGKTRVFSYSDV